MGKVHAALARAVARRGQPFTRPCVILSGGETTVTVRGSSSGRGGRASEFLLGCAIALQGQPGLWGLSADTDGIDGIEHNAGALIGPDTLARAVALGLKPAEYLDRNDACSFFSALGDLLVRGRPSPTSTISARCWCCRTAARQCGPRGRWSTMDETGPQRPEPTGRGRP